MLSLVTPSGPLRRLVAVLLTLSVMLTSLGWAHPECRVVTEHPHGAAVAAGHASISGLHAVSGAGRDVSAAAPVGTRSDSALPAGPCSDRHSTSDAGGCAMVAQCAPALLSTAAALSLPGLRAPTRSAVPTVGQPLERACQPDAPPPRA